MKRAILFVFLTIMVALASAQRLTLETCRQLARELYPLSKQYGLIDQSEEYSLSNAARGWLPKVRFSAMATWQTDAAQLPEGWAPLVAGTGSDQQGIRRDQYRVVLDVSQRIYDGGRSSAEKDVAKAQAETERRTVDVEMYALEGRVDDIFFGILLLEAQQEQLERRIEILEENKRRCQVLVDNELALESDADAVEVEIVNANQAMTQLQYSADAYREMLSLLTGWRIEEGTLVMPDDIVTLPTATRPDRPELQLLDAQLAYIDAQKRLLRTDSKPHFSFFALGWYGYPGLNMFEDMQSSRWSFNAIAGVRALWNVTSLFANRSINDQLYNRQQQIEVQRDIFTFNTSLQIKQEDREIARLQQTIQDDERIVTLRHSLRTAAESKYENGIVSITDVMDAITDESVARSAQVLHQIELLKKKYELKHTTYAN